MPFDLTYAELFAGAGGMSIGLEAAGWRCVAHAEIEPAARAVLRHKWPNVRLDGDVTQLNGADLKGITLLTGGSPCQDLSIAGKRAGMTEGSGTRSSLFFEQVRIWKESQASFILWENVYGAFSSNAGRDFAAVLSAIVGAAVAVPADGWRNAGVASGPAGVAAWRTLDAQHFGWDGNTTPQRRRRVFVLGTRTGAVDPAEVLLVADGLFGHLAAGGEAGEGVAADAGRGVEGANRRTIGLDQQRNASVEVMGSLNTGSASGGGQLPVVLSYDAVGVLGPGSHALTHEGADASEDGTGRGTPVVVAFAENQRGEVRTSDVALQSEERANTLQANQTQAVILRNREGKSGGGKGPLLSEGKRLTLGTHNDQVVFPRITHPTLMTDHFGKHTGCNQHVAELAQILPAIGIPRRLMPIECERLMGWPDRWTERGTDEQGREYALSDTARYKLCGNGIASPVAAWIGLRLRDALDSFVAGL